MKEKRRIFWYCEKWQVGGIQKVQVNLLKKMHTDRFEIVIASSEDDTTFFDEDLRSVGARKLCTLDSRYHSPIRRILANVSAVDRCLRTGNYDIVHFNVCHGVELIYLYLAKKRGIPVRIVHCRNNDIGAGSWMRPIKILAHVCCKYVFAGCANYRFANSALAAKWIFPRKYIRSGSVKIVKNGIDAERYAFDAHRREAVRQENGWEDRFVIGHIGHFNYQKNHDFLLHVFSEVKKLRPSSLLVLVGEGEREAEIRQLARELGIESSIIFYGVTGDVPGLLCAMDVFVLPSRFEGFGNVLVEAQANGLKCFASEGVIPGDVRITENLSWISLQEPYTVWAKRIVSETANESRKSHVDAVIDSGYDIGRMAAFFEHLYLGETGGTA